jgi:hypothetical protein
LRSKATRGGGAGGFGGVYISEQGSPAECVKSLENPDIFFITSE